VSNDKAVLNDVSRSDFSFGKIPAVPAGTIGSDEELQYPVPELGPFQTKGKVILLQARCG